ncbi:proteasome cyclosome repeat-containing protein [Cyclospora cayetanensis]|uniref:Proteasome cyclosome repeat-containing protein n=1 Tax=Cyclospora cayetanensis TaxID=88456 RepID=A0A1D3CR46_9EIME|nr:proteasome cyclosome repeat-containing protein [Cyclospora cayetanensis]
MAMVSTGIPSGFPEGSKHVQKRGKGGVYPPHHWLSAPSSAQGVLALLQENDTDIQQAALMELKDLVDVHWMELADALPDIEALAEEEAFPSRQLAAHLASRIYFHLEASADSLKFALESGDWLQLNDNSLYSQTILGKER